MKKLLSLLIVIMLILVVGCAGNPSKEPISEELPKEEKDFDYYLDKIESYPYYSYLNDPYLYSYEEDIKFSFFCCQKIEDPSSSRNGYYEKLEIGLKRSGIRPSHHQSFQSNPFLPVLTSDKEEELYSSIKEDGWWDNIYTAYKNCYKSNSILPVNEITGLGDESGAATLRYKESGKVIRIKNDYFQIGYRSALLDLEENFWSIPSDSKFYNYLEESFIKRFTSSTELGIRNRDYMIKYEKQVLSIQLTLTKIYSEEENDGNGSNEEV